VRHGIHRCLVLSAAALILLAGQAGAQTKPADPGLLSLDRIFASRDFAAERFGPARWMADGDSYTTLEPADGGGPGRDLVLYRAESGKREILVAAEHPGRFLDVRSGLGPAPYARSRLRALDAHVRQALDYRKH
jgi:hypothetical protein